jgi:hypothetical protein
MYEVQDTSSSTGLRALPPSHCPFFSNDLVFQELFQQGPRKLTVHYRTKAQAAQWERLGALLKTRKSIEKMILGYLKVVEQTTLNLSGELDVLYTGRLEEITEMSATGKVKEAT